MYNYRKVKLLFEDCIIDEDKIYFYGKEYNGLFCLDIKRGAIKYVSSIPGENVISKRMAIKLLKVKDELYVFPMNCKDIWIYNIKKMLWTKIELDSDYGRGYGNFMQAIRYESKIYVIGSTYRGIVSIDINSKEMKYYTKAYEGFVEYADCCFRSDYAMVDTKVYFASCLSNHIMRINLETEEVEMIEVGDKNNRYSGIAFDGSCFWLSPRHTGNIIKWDGGEIVEEIQVDFKNENTKFSFLGIVSTNDKIILPSMNNDKTLIISKSNSKEIIEETERYLCYKKYGSYTIKLTTNAKLTIIKDDYIEYEGECSINMKNPLEGYKVTVIEEENDLFDLNDYVQTLKAESNEECDLLLRGKLVYDKVMKKYI